MRFLLALVVGVVLGGAGAYFLFVGAPHAHLAKGDVVRAPDPSGPPPGTAGASRKVRFPAAGPKTRNPGRAQKAQR